MSEKLAKILTDSRGAVKAIPIETLIKENRLKTNSNKTDNRVGKTSSLLTKHEQRKPRVTRLQRNWYKKLGETTERLDV